MIYFNIFNTKPPVGGGRRSSWVSHWFIHSNDSFKRLIHSRMRQMSMMFMNMSLNLWLNRFVQNAESFSRLMKTGWVFLWHAPWFCCDFCLELFSLLKQNKNSQYYI